MLCSCSVDMLCRLKMLLICYPMVLLLFMASHCIVLLLACIACLWNYEVNNDKNLDRLRMGPQNLK